MLSHLVIEVGNQDDSCGGLMDVLFNHDRRSATELCWRAAFNGQEYTGDREDVIRGGYAFIALLGASVSYVSLHPRRRHEPR